MIRIVGLSATLPNYKDVGAFLGVNVETGLFYFDASFRPVPLEMQFVGVTEKNLFASKGVMDEVCYDKVRLDVHMPLLALHLSLHNCSMHSLRPLPLGLPSLGDEQCRFVVGVKGQRID